MPCVKEDLVFGNKGEEFIGKYLKKYKKYNDLVDLNESPDVRFLSFNGYSIFDFVSEKSKTLIEVKTRKSNIKPTDYPEWYCEGSKMKNRKTDGYRVLIVYIFTSTNEVFYHKVRRNEKYYDQYYTDFSRIQEGRNFQSRQIGLPQSEWHQYKKIKLNNNEIKELQKLDSTFLDLSDLSWFDED